MNINKYDVHKFVENVIEYLNANIPSDLHKFTFWICGTQDVKDSSCHAFPFPDTLIHWQMEIQIYLINTKSQGGLNWKSWAFCQSLWCRDKDLPSMINAWSCWKDVGYSAMICSDHMQNIILYIRWWYWLWKCFVHARPKLKTLGVITLLQYLPWRTVFSLLLLPPVST